MLLQEPRAPEVQYEDWPLPIACVAWLRICVSEIGHFRLYPGKNTHVVPFTNLTTRLVLAALVVYHRHNGIF